MGFASNSRGTEARPDNWQMFRRHHDRWHTGSAGGINGIQLRYCLAILFVMIPTITIRIALSIVIATL